MSDAALNEDDSRARAIEQAVNAASKRYAMANPQSQELHNQACRWMPGGNTRTGLFHAPFPLTIVQGEGPLLWDADGHRYIDFLSDFTAGVYGHSNPIIRAAIDKTLSRGVLFGSQNIYEAQLAELICERFASIESVRFCNSGTEANLLAIAAAKTATGRNGVLAFDGAYHGSLFTLTASGAPLRVPHEVVLARFNNVEDTEELIERHAGGLAAVIVEPMMGNAGCIPGTSRFLSMLRTATSAHGVVLIFDEVMTSRLSAGGMQSLMRIKPDLTTLGKYVGGGFSFGAFGGARHLMEQFDPRRDGAVIHSGTFNNNVATMAAGVAGYGQVFIPEAIEALNDAGDRLRGRINSLSRHRRMTLQATGVGSVMTLHFKAGDIREPEDLLDADRRLLQLLHLELLEAGYFIAARGLLALSLPLTAEHHESLLIAFESFADKYGELCPLPV